MINVEQLCIIKFSVTIMLSFRCKRKNVQTGKVTEKTGKRLMSSSICYLNGFGSSEVRQVLMLRQKCAACPTGLQRECLLGDPCSPASCLQLLFVSILRMHHLWEVDSLTCSQDICVLTRIQNYLDNAWKSHAAWDLWVSPLRLVSPLTSLWRIPNYKIT